jgi:flagellar motor switch protein FliM
MDEKITILEKKAYNLQIKEALKANKDLIEILEFLDELFKEREREYMFNFVTDSIDRNSKFKEKYEKFLRDAENKYNLNAIDLISLKQFIIDLFYYKHNFSF